jgi:predicted RNA methylase
MQEHPGLFDGKAVLEIGTGSGIISLYAAELGATRVVATDISLAAVACARANVLRLHHEATVEVRQVPKKAPTAYSVIRPGETFDLIISNPPYSLDLAPIESRALEDSGDLGFSIIRGLAAHLAPAGACILLYDSHFYHNVIVKLAQHLGYKVAHQEPTILSPLETEALYNSYLSRLLAREHLSPDSFEFDWTKDKLVLFVETKPQSLFGEAKPRKHPGIIVITRNVSEGEN